MSEQVVQKAVQATIQISVHHPVQGVNVNGHGETTYAPGWTETCGTLIRANIPICIIANLSKNFSEIELEVLAWMDTVTLSIDTSDRDLLKRVRRKVDIRRIISNIASIRATSRRLKKAPPAFQFSCGLYDKNASLVEDLAWFAIALGVKKVIFWNLLEHSYEGTNIRAADQVHRLASLNDTDLRLRIDAIDRAISDLRRHNVDVEVVADFLDELRERVRIHE